MADYEIGTRTFFNGRGAPPGQSEIVEVIHRPATDGSAFRKLGTKGRPFQLETLRDFTSISDAEAELVLYRALIGTAQNLKWKTFDYFVSQTRQVVILDVTPTELSKHIKAVGGIVANSTVLLIARWTMATI